MKKKILYSVLAISVIVVITCGSMVYASSVHDKGKELGQQVATIEKNGSNGMVANVDGYEITESALEIYKITASSFGDYSDKELLDNMIERRALYNQADSEGFEVSDEEVNVAIEAAKTALLQDEEQYKFLKEYLNGLGKSEDQYWSEMREEYKKDLATGKLYESIREDFIKNNNFTDPNDIKSKFDVYWDAYKKDLVSKADVQTDIK